MLDCGLRINELTNLKVTDVNIKGGHFLVIGKGSKQRIYCFFTTKEIGTGLGLAVCYSIAARHNARINVKTGSEGTTFFVRFGGRDTIN